MLTYQKYQLNWCCKRFFYQLWCFNAIPLNMMSQDHFRWLKPKSRLLVVQHPHRLTVSPPRLWWSHRGVKTACPKYLLFKAILKTIKKTLEQNDQAWTSFAQLPAIKQNEETLQQLNFNNFTAHCTALTTNIKHKQIDNRTCRNALEWTR